MILIQRSVRTPTRAATRRVRECLRDFAERQRARAARRRELLARPLPRGSHCELGAYFLMGRRPKH